MSDKRNILDDLPDLDDAPFREVESVLAALTETPRPEKPEFRRSAREVRGLLLDRALNLLRTGSRTEIGEEAYGLHRYLDSPPGESLQEKAPEVHGGFRAIADLLSGAADRADAAAVDSILRSHKGRGKEILEFLAQQGEPVKRSRIRSQLGVSQSHLSHILREMEGADLLVRWNQGKEVLVELAPNGREYVERSILPSWIQRVIEELHAVRRREVRKADAQELERDLHEHGAPSRLLACQLAAALAELRSYEDPANAAGAAYVVGVSQREGWHFDKAMDRQGDRTAMSAYGPN